MGRAVHFLPSRSEKREAAPRPATPGEQAPWCWSHDLAGLAHVAVPLASGERYFGTVLAGQVFDRYPDALGVGRTAKEYGVSEQRLWSVARQQVPVSRANLEVYGSLLLTLGEALLGQR